MWCYCDWALLVIRGFGVVSLMMLMTETLRFDLDSRLVALGGQLAFCALFFHYQSEFDLRAFLDCTLFHKALFSYYRDPMYCYCDRALLVIRGYIAMISTALFMVKTLGFDVNSDSWLLLLVTAIACFAVSLHYEPFSIYKFDWWYWYRDWVHVVIKGYLSMTSMPLLMMKTLGFDFDSRLVPAFAFFAVLLHYEPFPGYKFDTRLTFGIAPNPNEVTD
jgi:hypothetical protein